MEINLTKLSIVSNIYIIVVIIALSIAISATIIISYYKKLRNQFTTVVKGISESPLLDNKRNMNFILNRSILQKLNHENQQKMSVELPNNDSQQNSAVHLNAPNQTISPIQTTEASARKHKKEAAASYFDIINSVTYRAEEYFSPAGSRLYLPYVFAFIMLLCSFFMWWISLAFNLVFEFGLGYLCHKSLLLPRAQFKPRNKIIMYSIVSSVQLLWELVLIFLLLIILVITFIIRARLSSEASKYGYGIECFSMDSLASHLDGAYEGCGMLARMTQYNFIMTVAFFLLTIPAIIIKSLLTILIPTYYIKLRIENIPTSN